MNEKYVHYGCGLTAPEEWINYDISPTLRFQRTPFLGKILKSRLNTIFPENVQYGDIIKGLPVEDNSCDGVYCSHTLEHLSLVDFRKAVKNTFRILKQEGIFRCVVPDLEYAARNYITALDKGDAKASIWFMGEGTLLGQEIRPTGIKGLLTYSLGNSNHLWMWDRKSLAEELLSVGFSKVRECSFNDSTDKMFMLVEEESRFENAVALECIK